MSSSVEAERKINNGLKFQKKKKNCGKRAYDRKTYHFNHFKPTFTLLCSHHLFLKQWKAAGASMSSVVGLKIINIMCVGWQISNQ
jgi:hypothetical protein